jgi:hypothetical protein
VSQVPSGERLSLLVRSRLGTGSNGPHESARPSTHQGLLREVPRKCGMRSVEKNGRRMCIPEFCAGCSPGLLHSTCAEEGEGSDDGWLERGLRAVVVSD